MNLGLRMRGDAQQHVTQVRERRHADQPTALQQRVQQRRAMRALATSPKPYRAAASSRRIGMALRDNELQPAWWYLVPVLVT